MLGIATELALPAKKSACLVQNLLDHFEMLLLMWRSCEASAVRAQILMVCYLAR